MVFHRLLPNHCEYLFWTAVSSCKNFFLAFYYQNRPRKILHFLKIAFEIPQKTELLINNSVLITSSWCLKKKIEKIFPLWAFIIFAAINYSNILEWLFRGQGSDYKIADHLSRDRSFYWGRIIEHREVTIGNIFWLWATSN